MKKLNILEDTVTFEEKDIEYFKSVLKKSQLSIFNSELIIEFQEKFLKFLKGKIKSSGIVALPNCTSAIFIALQMLDLKLGDEIIVPNLTHSSSIYPIVYLYGCKIKICDFSEVGYELDLEHLKSLITPKTKALLLCYLHGYPTNSDKVLKICKEKNINLIEDCAQGLGIKINDVNVGNFGEFACFSFGENKLLRLGEGGALKYNNDDDLEKINRLRHVGEVWKENGRSTLTNDITYKSLIEKGIDYRGMGFNYRVNPLNIVVGLTKLNNLNTLIKERREKLELYKNKLSKIEGIKLISENVYNTAPLSAWFLLDPKKFDVDKIIFKLLEYGIPAGKFKYPLVMDMDAFKNYILNLDDNFKNSNNLKNNSLFLPLYENIKIKDIEDITSYLIKIFTEYENLSIDKNILNKKVKYFDGFFIK